MSSMPTRAQLFDRLHLFFRSTTPDDLSPGDLLPGTASEIEVIRQDEQIPHSGDRGIYFFVDDSDQVLYIGSATVAFGTRYWDHHAKRKDHEGWAEARHFHPLVLQGETTDRKLRMIQALEAYLIATLWPKLNERV